MEDICKVSGNYFLSHTHYAFKQKHGSENVLLHLKSKQVITPNQYGCVVLDFGEYSVEVKKDDDKRGILGLFKGKKRSSSIGQTSGNLGSNTSLSSTNSKDAGSQRRRSANNKKDEKGTTRLADLEALMESEGSKSGENITIKKDQSHHELMMKESSTQELGMNLPSNLLSKRIINERKEKVNSKLLLKILHPPMVQGHVKSCLNSIGDQKISNFFAELKDYELLLFTNVTRQKLVKKLTLTKNSLAVADTKEPHKFDFYLDADMYSIEADGHEEMLRWVATINTSANTIYLVNVLNEQSTRDMVRDLLQSGLRDKKSSDYVSEAASIIRDLRAVDFSIVSIANYTVPELTSDQIQSILHSTEVLKKDTVDVLPEDSSPIEAPVDTVKSKAPVGTLGRRKSLMMRPNKQDPISETGPVDTVNVIPPALSATVNGTSVQTPPQTTVLLPEQPIKASESTLSDKSTSQLEVSKISSNNDDAWLTSPVEASNIQDEIIKMTGMDVKKKSMDIQFVSDVDSQISIKYGLDEMGKRNRFCIHSCTIDKFIERLTDEYGPPEDSFMELFILGCRHFSTIPKTLDKLMKRFNAKHNNSNSDDSEYFRKNRTSVRARIVKLLLHWIRGYVFDFKIHENRMLLEQFFIVFELCDFAEVDDVLLEQQLHDSYCELAALGRYYLQLKLAVSKSVNTKQPPLKRKDLAEFEVSDIAQQICVVEFEKFSKIRPFELVIQLWGDLKEPSVSAELEHYGAMIQQFNQLSYWVATEITTQPELKPRVKLIEKFIKIAKELERYRNYNGLMAIVSGLNLAAVSRLKMTWELVSDKLKEVLSELETAVSPASNYKNYRQIFDRLEREQDDEPFIPFLGLLAKDLFFINDGNPKMYDKLVNVDKLATMLKKAHAIQKFQRKAFQFPYLDNTSAAYEFCMNLRALKEPHIYKYSQLVTEREKRELQQQQQN